MKNFIKNPYTITWIICLICFIGICFIPNKYNVPRAEDCVVIDKLLMANGSEHAPRTSLCLALKNSKNEICVINVNDNEYFLAKKGDKVCYMLSDYNFKRDVSVFNGIFHVVIPLLLFIGFFICLIISIFDYDNDNKQQLLNDALDSMRELDKIKREYFNNILTNKIF